MSQMQCQCDPALRQEWGCEEPAQRVVWRDLDENDYYSCPVRYIPVNVVEWYAEYLYYKEFSSAPGRYDQIPGKWHEALSEYHKALNQYIEMVKPKGPDKTGALKMGLKGRKHG